MIIYVYIVILFTLYIYISIFTCLLKPTNSIYSFHPFLSRYDFSGVAQRAPGHVGLLRNRHRGSVDAGAMAVGMENHRKIIGTCWVNPWKMVIWPRKMDDKPWQTNKNSDLTKENGWWTHENHDLTPNFSLSFKFIMGIEVLTIGVETKQNLWWTNLSTLEPILGPS